MLRSDSSVTVVNARGSSYGGSSGAAVHLVFVCIFVFLNLFNPISPYLTFAVNTSLAFALLVRSRFRLSIQDPIVLACAYFALGWLLLVTVFRGGGDEQVVLKYLRVALTVSLFVVIFGSGRISSGQIVKAINLALAFHVALILLQVPFPDLTYKTAPIFGFDREIEILDQYTMRKLGASSSYDTASLFSLAALLFFYLQFERSRRMAHLMMAGAAFVATLMSSRVGIAFSIVIMLVIFIREFMKASFLWKSIAAFAMVGFVVFTYISIYPLVLHSLGYAELHSYDSGLLFAATDYGTTGTMDALMDDHLLPLQQPFEDLLIGFAIDPNTIDRFTDIGYVKLIYHIGIVGTLAVLIAHIYILVAARRMSHGSRCNEDAVLVAHFLYAFVAIALIFNYKSLELHSRGVGDFVYLLFFFLASQYGRPRVDMCRE